ncbi:hypothetical protein DF3PB_90033 [uncultured Defluviicoccus sp.]|uniref:Uncharacterized protein n=1 Tax=metagenome TaxID=256318 RepID=A0A380TM45_9ZZZZ|nr:hypothetical protein DF3PB_90033 [uncultured Defluviicoccus sp.]
MTCQKRSHGLSRRQVGYVGYGDDGLKLPKNLTADAAGENVAQQKQQ